MLRVRRGVVVLCRFTSRTTRSQVCFTAATPVRAQRKNNSRCFPSISSFSNSFCQKKKTKATFSSPTFCIFPLAHHWLTHCLPGVIVSSTGRRFIDLAVHFFETVCMLLKVFFPSPSSTLSSARIPLPLELITKSKQGSLFFTFSRHS